MNIFEYIDKIGMALKKTDEGFIPASLIIKGNDKTTPDLFPDQWGETEVRKGLSVQIGIFDEQQLFRMIVREKDKQTNTYEYPNSVNLLEQPNITVVPR